MNEGRNLTITLPVELYDEAQRLAERIEWSLLDMIEDMITRELIRARAASRGYEPPCESPPPGKRPTVTLYTDILTSEDWDLLEAIVGPIRVARAAQTQHGPRAKSRTSEGPKGLEIEDPRG